MEAVDLVAGQQIDVVLDELGWKEVARDVEVHAPIGETGGILDLRRGQHERRRSAGLGVRGHELAQRLKPVQQARMVRGREIDPVSGDDEAVALRDTLAVDADPECAIRRRIERQCTALPVRRRPHVEDGSRSVVGRVVEMHRYVGIQREAAVPHDDLLWHGHDRMGRPLIAGGEKRSQGPECDHARVYGSIGSHQTGLVSTRVWVN